jgi:glycosyltransferase involved in cell wall biosynthesis
VALVAAAAGLDETTAVLVELHTFAVSLLSAAVRLGMIDHVSGQRLRLRAQPALLEAAAAGRPTIALARGGALETMIGLGRGDDAPPTALFFEEQTEAALTQAILDFEAAEKRFDPVALRARAAEFDTAVFRRRLREYLEGRWAEFQARRAC